VVIIHQGLGNVDLTHYCRLSIYSYGLIQAETSSVGNHKQKETRKPISQPILEELEKIEDKQPQILSEIS
jgi:hypothetical protein